MLLLSHNRQLQITKLETNINKLEFDVKNLEDKIETDIPKVEFYDNLAPSPTLITIGELAKIISDKSHNIIGQNQLFNYLRKSGYLISNGISHNPPYQKYINLGYFKLIQLHSNNKYYLRTMVTGLGEIVLVKEIVSYIQ